MTSFVIVEDEGKILQVRASVGTRDDLVSLIEKLQSRLDGGFFEGKENDNTIRTGSVSNAVSRSGF